MNGDQLRRLLRSQEAPAEPDPTFAEELFSTLRQRAAGSDVPRRSRFLLLAAAALLLTALAGATLAVGGALLDVPWESREESSPAPGSVAYCGAVERSASGISAVFEYVGDQAVPASTVRIGEYQIDSSLLGPGALGLLELAHNASSEPAFRGEQLICVELELVDEEMVGAVVHEDSYAALCGYIGVGSATMGLNAHTQPSPGTFALVDDAILGFAFASFTTDQLPNLGKLFYLAQSVPLCLDVGISGGTGGTISASATLEGCLIIEHQTDAQLTVGYAFDDPWAPQTLQLIDGSQIDDDLPAGVPVGMRISAERGEGGPIHAHLADVPDCTTAEPPAPTEPPAPQEPPAPLDPTVGELVFSVTHQADVGPPSSISLVEDGRLVSARDAGRYEQQLLTPVGIALIGDEIRSTGLFEQSSEFPLILLPGAEPPGMGAMSITIVFATDAELIRVSWIAGFDDGTWYEPSPERQRLDALAVRLRSLEEWLPDEAWADPILRPYVPARYRLFTIAQPSGGDPADLPADVADVAWPLADTLMTYGEMHTEAFDDWSARCAVVSLEEAASVADALAMAGAPLDTALGDPFGTRVEVADRSTSRAVWVVFEGLRPEETSCSDARLPWY